MSRVTMLQWWPFDPMAWIEATQLLAPEAQAAIMRLNCAAWTNAARPAHLPATDAILAVASGLSAAAWKKHRAAVLEHFPITEPGWRVAAMVADTYAEQREKYDKRVSAGSAGGWANSEKPRKATRKATRNATSNATDNATRNASRTATRNAPLEVRTTREPSPWALTKSPEGEGSLNRNSNIAPRDERAASSPACAPCQGAPPTPPLWESTNSHSHSHSDSPEPRHPLPPPRAVHPALLPPADPGWHPSPRMARPVSEAPTPIGAILATMLTPTNAPR